MYIEIYNMIVENGGISINLEAVCDSFSSFLWDVEYYSCGAFEVYIAATPENLNIFRTGRIIGRSDDKKHYGIIEKIQLKADAENGDYLTISGRFLMSLLSRRIISSTVRFTTETPYYKIVKEVINKNCINLAPSERWRTIPGLKISDEYSENWAKTTHLQVSYENIMDWIYSICEIVGGTANIRLKSDENGEYSLIFELSQGTDRSILQKENPHIIFSDIYNNLLSFDYLLDTTDYSNLAYVWGQNNQKGTRLGSAVYSGEKLPEHLNLHEIYVDARDISNEEQGENGETTEIPDNEYFKILATRGKEKLTPVQEISESMIAVNNKQFQYNKDYFLGDYVTVRHDRFGLEQPKIQLVGMIESFDSNGYSLTPTFKGV